MDGVTKEEVTLEHDENKMVDGILDVSIIANILSL